MTDPNDCVKAHENPDLLEAEAYELLAKAKRIRAALAAPASDELLDAEMLKSRYHVSMRCALDAVRRGESLVVEHAGRKPVVRRSAIEAWLASRRTTSRSTVVETDKALPIDRAAARLRRSA